MNREVIESRMEEIKKQDAALGEQVEILQQEVAARQKALVEISAVRTRLYGAHEELARLLKGDAPTLKMTESADDGSNHDGQ